MLKESQISFFKLSFGDIRRMSGDQEREMGQIVDKVCGEISIILARGRRDIILAHGRRISYWRVGGGISYWRRSRDLLLKTAES